MMGQFASLKSGLMVGALAWVLPTLAGAQAAAVPAPAAPALPAVPAQPAQPTYAPPPAPAPAPAPNSPSNMSFVPSGSASATYESSGQVSYGSGQAVQQVQEQPPEAAYQAPVVGQAPPSPVQEVIPVSPAPSYVWAPGYWYWYGSEYTWVPGRWLAPHPGYFYIGARWDFRGGSWTFIPGGWSLSLGGPVAYPIFLHTWARPSFAYPRAYVAPAPVYPRYYAPHVHAPRVYVAPPAHHHYVAPPVRGYVAPRVHTHVAPPRRFYAAPPARHSGGGSHYTAPPARGNSRDVHVGPSRSHRR